MAASPARKMVFIGPEHRRYGDERALRWEVLRKPLGAPFGAELFPFEDQSLHLILVEDDDVTGCVLFHPEDTQSGRLFQMAVRPQGQRSGRGAALVRHLEARLKADGYRHVHLHARLQVRAFYEKLGYQQRGDTYEELGIPHVMMERVL